MRAEATARDKTNESLRAQLSESRQLAKEKEYKRHEEEKRYEKEINELREELSKKNDELESILKNSFIMTTTQTPTRRIEAH
jgi:hypothetical protein